MRRTQQCRNAADISAYDIFRRVVFQTNAPWFPAASGEIGQTNFALPMPATNSSFYIAAEGGGGGGELNILLRSPAPTNGTKLLLHLADGYLEGWESLFVTPDFTPTDVSLDFQLPAVLFIREDTADTSSLPGSDVDLDGLPDYWEVANALNAQSPITQGEAELDADGDGLTNLEEYQFGTSARAADTDANGVNDFLQNVLGADPGPDFVPVRFFVHDTGKVNNGMNCAVCHTTQLKVGDYSLYSTRSANQEPAEKTYWYRKGQSYPIFLREVVLTLPPTTNTSGNPTTTAQYTAALLPGTNLPQAFVVQDPANKLGTNLPWSNFPSNTLTQVATLVVPKVELSWTNFPDSPPLDNNSNILGGVRIYPDRLSPTDNQDRKHALLNIKTTPPVPGQQILLKSFDVDDPIELPFDDNLLIDSSDFGNIPIGNDNRGSPKPGVLYQTNVTLDVFGQASVIFDVTMQPGDNFRVAAMLNTPGASNHMNALQVTSPFDIMYVQPGQGPAFGFIGALSPMLTVWRKLHLEFDSMGSPPSSGPEAAFIPTVVWRVQTNSPVAGHSKVTLIWTNGHNAFNEHERGKFEVTGVVTNRTLNSWTRVAPGGRTFTDVEIDAILPGNLLDLPAKLYDDDDQYLANDHLYPSILGLQSPPLPADARSGEFVAAMQFRYAEAYITLVDANAMGWNTQSTVPFKRQATPQAIVGFSTVFDSGNLQLKGKDTNEFWAWSVVFGYEPLSAIPMPTVFVDDGDPDRETPLTGTTAKWKAIHVAFGFGIHEPLGYSVIFVESIRDREFGIVRKAGLLLPEYFTDSSRRPSLTNEYLNDLYGVIAHEIGHAPGRQSEKADHNEKGLMEEGAPTITETGLSPTTIKRFRQAQSWTR